MSLADVVTSYGKLVVVKTSVKNFSHSLNEKR